MNLSNQIAKHLREVFFGGNWTSVNVRDTLKTVNREQAVASIDTLNSIAKLTFHMNYYVSAILKVLEGGTLDAHDRYSFDLPPINSEDDWQNLIDKTFKEAEQLVNLIEQFPDDKLGDYFVEEKYGTYYRNFHGLIEHTHYHLGQVALIKKIHLLK